MSILPENKLKEKNITPKIYLIWGESMSGKTFFARQFPNPIILNTDGNAKKVDTPSVEIKDWETFIQAIKELQNNKEFETVIIDLIDDIKTMLDNYIIKTYNQTAKKEALTLSDIPWGGGFSQSKDTFKNLMIKLTNINKNIIFISHMRTKTEITPVGSEDIELPSLEDRYLNMTMGRCDVVIKARKIGPIYNYTVTHKRDKYTKEDIKDERILEVLKDTKKLFEGEK